MAVIDAASALECTLSWNGCLLAPAFILLSAMHTSLASCNTLCTPCMCTGQRDTWVCMREAELSFYLTCV